MAKPRCQYLPAVVIAPDPNAKVYWCPDCKLDKKWNEYSRRAMCPECRSEEWCSTCQSSQIKGREYCEPTADQKWAKQEREAVLFYVFVCLPIALFGLPVLLAITNCALYGARVCR